MANDNITYTEVYESANNHALMSNVLRPIIIDGQKVGVVAIDVAVDELTKMTKTMTTGNSGYVFLMTNTGQFVCHPQFSTSDNIADVHAGALKEFLANVQKNGSVEAIVDVEGAQKLYRTSPIGSTGIILVTSNNYEELLAPVNVMATGMSIAGVIVILLLGWSILHTVMYITKSINFMVEACHRLAEGDFRDNKLTLNSNDEIGVLSEALVEMRTKLRVLFKKVSETAEQVAAASEELKPVRQRHLLQLTR